MPLPSSIQQRSPTPSLYEHDLNESLDSMTLQKTHCISSRSVSSPACSLPAKSCTAPSTTQLVSPPDTATRIPRRVKSNESYKSTPSSGVVSQCLISGGWSSVGGGDSASLDPDVELWLDMIPLSRRPFKNFHRDFSDGVLMAEVMLHFLPKRVDLHNYPSSSSTPTKKSNWDTLNMKVFSKLGIRLSDSLIDGITQSKPGYIEKALKQIHRLIENMDRKLLDTRAKELSGLAASFDGTTMHPPFVEDWCLVRCSPGEVPDCVIYQNIKYYCSAAFDEVQRGNEQLRERNNELSAKVKRMEVLLSLKESHLNDLTKKIHELRGKCENRVESNDDQ